jgi:hypothetical protein
MKRHSGEKCGCFVPITATDVDHNTLNFSYGPCGSANLWDVASRGPIHASNRMIQ